MTTGRTAEQHARDYCRALGKDPDEPVWGSAWVGPPGQEHRCRLVKPRWQWIVGAHPALASGAHDLSPAQRRLGHGLART